MVYVYPAIYKTYFEYWCSIDLWLSRREGWGQSVMGVSAFCSI